MAQIDFQQIPATAYVALCSALIATCALVVSITQMRMQRRHYKLSVRPFLDFHVHNTNGAPIKFEIFNAGSGPAIIKSFQVKMGKDTLTSPTGPFLVSALQAAGIPGDKIKFYYSPTLPKCIKPGESRELLALDPAVTNIPQKPSRNIGFCLEYESIYEEKFRLEIAQQLD